MPLTVQMCPSFRVDLSWFSWNICTLCRIKLTIKDSKARKRVILQWISLYSLLSVEDIHKLDTQFYLGFCSMCRWPFKLLWEEVPRCARSLSPEDLWGQLGEEPQAPASPPRKPPLDNLTPLPLASCGLTKFPMGRDNSSDILYSYFQLWAHYKLTHNSPNWRF